MVPMINLHFSLLQGVFDLFPPVTYHLKLNNQVKQTLTLVLKLMLVQVGPCAVHAHILTTVPSLPLICFAV